jgi:UDP:flavonoid glycosyltransferase YjiC (YdhE family)
MRGGDVVVFLHLFEKDTARMLRILGDPLLSHHKFILKPHPGLPLSRLRRLIPANARIVEEDIYSLLSSARAVIGAGSGSMVEAVASGVPVICIKGGRQFDYNRGFFDKGEGIIWAEAASAAELLTQLERIGKSAESGETMQELAREYADHYFCRPTEDLIRSAFDFDHPKRKGRYDG